MQRRGAAAVIARASSTAAAASEAQAPSIKARRQVGLGGPRMPVPSDAQRPPLLSHLQGRSRLPRMVSIVDKPATRRQAVAVCQVRVPESVARLFSDEDFRSPKGAVLSTAIAAGTLAAKRTADLIPLCHNIALRNCFFRARLTELAQPSGDLTHALSLMCTVEALEGTGPEMEALTGASVAALTAYDMLKSVSSNMVITGLRVLLKEGGKSSVGGAEGANGEARGAPRRPHASGAESAAAASASAPESAP